MTSLTLDHPRSRSTTGSIVPGSRAMHDRCCAVKTRSLAEPTRRYPCDELLEYTAEHTTAAQDRPAEHVLAATGDMC